MDALDDANRLQSSCYQIHILNCSLLVNPSELPEALFNAKFPFDISTPVYLTFHVHVYILKGRLRLVMVAYIHNNLYVTHKRSENAIQCDSYRIGSHPEK